MASPDDIDRRIADARAIADAGERAARLFVIAAALTASGDASEVARGRALLEEAAREGSTHAALELGVILTGSGDSDAGVAWMARAAEDGLAAAALLLGGMLLTVEARARDGVAWLRKAAAAQEWSAFWLLGVAHLRGLGVAADAAQARMLLQEAAGHGVAEAQLELAAMYAGGVGGARDQDAAAAWEKRAAEVGNPIGCVRVAERALAEPGGLVRALPWLERAAGFGSVEAAERLAALYRAGGEIARDDDAAARWRERAEELRRPK
jgi:TPR repeat protein